MDVSGDRASESVEVVSYYLSRNHPGNRLTSPDLSKTKTREACRLPRGFFRFYTASLFCFCQPLALVRSISFIY